jgi:hypothetical protein
MPFVLLFVGIILLVSALRGTSSALFATLKSDFTGSGNYFYWVMAILAVGSIGYVKKLQPISDAFLVLLLVVLTLSNKGFFAQFVSGMSGAAATGCVTASTSSTITNPVAAVVNSGTILGNQASTQPTALATPGQSAGTAWNNTVTNFNAALNSGSFGGN